MLLSSLSLFPFPRITPEESACVHQSVSWTRVLTGPVQVPILPERHAPEETLNLDNLSNDSGVH
jgi:hypothetical protein